MGGPAGRIDGRRAGGRRRPRDQLHHGRQRGQRPRHRHRRPRLDRQARPEQRGLTSKTAPATVEELVEAGRAAGTDEVLALPVGDEGNAYFMQPFYSSAGGYLFGTYSDGTYDTEDLGIGAEGSVTAGTKMAALAREGVLKTSISTDNATDLFTTGRTPYLISGPWSLSGVKEAGIDYAIAKIPGFEGMNEAVPFAGVNVFYGWN
ncbi:MAG: hypothetical protein DI576_07555 [Actinomyces sp.]|nr:MAG: hypothetical protein DI576_07555 [Actinomyces sp.]